MAKNNSALMLLALVAGTLSTCGLGIGTVGFVVYRSLELGFESAELETREQQGRQILAHPSLGYSLQHPGPSYARAPEVENQMDDMIPIPVEVFVYRSDEEENDLQMILQRLPELDESSARSTLEAFQREVGDVHHHEFAERGPKRWEGKSWVVFEDRPPPHGPHARVRVGGSGLPDLAHGLRSRARRARGGARELHAPRWRGIGPVHAGAGARVVHIGALAPGPALAARRLRWHRPLLLGRVRTLTLLLAESTDGIRGAFSFGGNPDLNLVVSDGVGYENTPFDHRDRWESYVRSPLSFVSSLRTPTYFFEGIDGTTTPTLATAMERGAARSGGYFRGFVLEGHDHWSAVPALGELIASELARGADAEGRLELREEEVRAVLPVGKSNSQPNEESNEEPLDKEP